MNVNFFSSKECEYADMEVFIGGKSIVKLRGMQYKTMQDKEPLHGAGNQPISIQRGNKTYSGTLTILKGALDDLNRAAIVAGGADITDVDFDIVVTYAPKGSRDLQVDTVVGVSIAEFEKGFTQGAKMMEVALPFVALRIQPA